MRSDTFYEDFMVKSRSYIYQEIPARKHICGVHIRILAVSIFRITLRVFRFLCRNMSEFTLPFIIPRTALLSSIQPDA